MSSALLILSPLDTGPLHAKPAAELAITLKDQGVKRVDLTADSHYSTAQSHGCYAVTPFTRAVHHVAEVMGQVIGATRMYDLPAAFDRALEPPSQTFDLIARLCLERLTGDHTRRDARELAMIFYATVHAGQYDHLVFPHMSRRAQHALFVIAHNLRDKETGLYGHPIRLDRIRKLVFTQGRIETAPVNATIN